MRIFSTFFGGIIGVAFLAALTAGGYFLFKYVASIFATLAPQVETLAVIATVVALLCAVIIAEGMKASNQKEHLSIVSVEKAKIYEPLLYLWSEQLKNTQSRDKQEIDSDELVGLEQLLALHGSPKVITAYINLRLLTKQEEKPGDEAIELLKKLLVEMRADLGRAEFNLNKNDLWDLLLARH